MIRFIKVLLMQAEKWELRSQRVLDSYRQCQGDTETKVVTVTKGLREEEIGGWREFAFENPRA